MLGTVRKKAQLEYEEFGEMVVVEVHVMGAVSQEIQSRSSERWMMCRYMCWEQ